MPKQFPKARRYFEKSIKKGNQKALRKMKNGGFDGINYNKTFNIEIDGGIASAPREITSDTEAGLAKLMGSSATDIPTVDFVSTTSMLQNGGIVAIGIESTFYDAQKAANMNSNVLVKKGELVIKKIEEFHNKACWGIDDVVSAAGILGFFSHPFVIKSSFGVGATTGKVSWNEKNADEIIKDITDMIRAFYSFRPDIRESGVKAQIHMSSSYLDILTLKMVDKDNSISVLVHLEKILPKNRFNVEFVVTNSLGSYIAIGDFRADSMSYNIPMTTEPMDVFEVGLTLRQNFVAESRGLEIEKENSAIIYEGA